MESLGAITHVDGTARIQTVNREQNPDYLALIEAYGRLTNVYCVLNTSFNVRGEPIVHSPEDALKCFFTTDMDDLFIGPFALEKVKERGALPRS
jgi:carbamoyltransferase